MFSVAVDPFKEYPGAIHGRKPDRIDDTTTESMKKVRNHKGQINTGLPSKFEYIVVYRYLKKNGGLKTGKVRCKFDAR